MMKPALCPSLVGLALMIGASSLSAAPSEPMQSAPSAPAAGRNRIVAIVNSEVITAADVLQAMAPLYDQYQNAYHPDELPSKMEEARSRITQLLIEEKLMLQEARNPRTFEMAKGKWATPIPIEVSAEELADALAEAKSRFPSEAEFQGILKQHGMTLKDLEARYRDQLTVQKIIDRDVRSRIAISPSEMTAFYQEHMDQYKTQEAARLSNILIRVSATRDDRQASSQIQNLLQILKTGADFADLARKYSEGPNAEGGGMIGWVERGRLLPEIEQPVFDLEPGQLSGVIKSSLGYHIFRLEEKRPAHTRPISEVQGEIRNKLYQEKYQKRYVEWMSKLKEHAYITLKE